MTRTEKYKPYAEYKPSESEWMGNVPSHWKDVRFKHELVEKKKTTNPSLRCGAISFGNVVYKNDESIPTETKASYQEVLAGEFLVNPLNLNYDLKSLRTALSFIDVVVSTGYIVLRSRSSLNKMYLRWLLFHFDVSHMKTLGSGVRQTINYADIGNSFFSYPPLPEQRAIATFLDRETGKIDLLVSKQERMIALLKEKRQAVISHAVTKGLDPNVPMKDSGVEWLGEIPGGWDIKPLRFLGACQNGINIGAESFGSGFPFVSYGDVYNNRTLPDVPSGLVQSTAEDRKRYSLKVGDVLFTRTSETLEEIGFASSCLCGIPNACFAGFLIRFRPYAAELDVEFSKHYFSNQLLRSFFANKMNLVTRASLSQDLLKMMPVVLPPKVEQREIAEYLDAKTTTFTLLIAKAEQAIALMKERRTALISAAVTGQIDVREEVEAHARIESADK